MRIVNAREIDTLQSLSISVPIPKKCPRCHASIFPSTLSSFYRSDKFASLFYCSSCDDFFIGSGEISLSKIYNLTTEPSMAEDVKFSDSISLLSSDFVEIYNESFHAEQLGYRHICGAGYRKSLEFLVKSYAIHKHPDDVDAIAKQSLSQSINNYIENPKIKTLAISSAWVGNDEIHFIKKHDDKSYIDMKKFISAIVSYIEMELTVEEAGSILAK